MAGREEEYADQEQMELVEQDGMGCTRIEAVPQAEYSHGLWRWQSNAPEVLRAP